MNSAAVGLREGRAGRRGVCGGGGIALERSLGISVGVRGLMGGEAGEEVGGLGEGTAAAAAGSVVAGGIMGKTPAMGGMWKGG